MTKDFRVGGLEFIDDLEDLIGKYLTVGTVRLGLAVKGMVQNGVILKSSLLGLSQGDFHLVRRLEKRFGVKVRAENDVKAQALAEARFGSGKSFSSFALVNIGTGLGSAFVNEGVLLRGKSSSLGSIWKIPTFVLELNKSVDLQDVLSGWGVESLYQTLSGKELASAEVFRRVGDDPSARTVVEIFVRKLSELLIMITRFYNPEAVILTGGLLTSASVFLQPAVDLFKENVIPVQVPMVEVSSLEHAACLGMVVIDGEEDSQH